MRFVLAAAALLFAAFASADRLIKSPTGYGLRSQEFRAEMWWTADRFDQGFAGYGLTSNLEIGATLDRGPGNSDRFGLDFSYNYIRPILDYAPGLSVGVYDLMNETSEGRSVYLAATIRMGNFDPANQDVPTELTVGGWSRHKGSAFVSFSLPFAEQFRLIAEYEGREISAGFDVRPLPGTYLRWVFTEGRPAYGAGIKIRF